MRTTRARRLLAAAAAVVVLAVDLTHELLTPTPFHHVRSPGAFVTMVALATLVLVFVPRVDSVAASLGAGIAAGGALGMVVSGLAWSNGVPDPFVRGGYAFNLGDVAIVVGDVLLLVAVTVHAWDNRGELHRAV
jgi:lipoprotein signal peptidase